MPALPTAARDWDLWSTRCRLVVTEPARLDDAAALVDGVLREVELASSRFRPDSELLRLAPGADGWTEVGPVLAGLLEAALRVAEETDGAVDPTIGSALIALGYDTDIATVRTRGDVAITLTRPAPGWRSVTLEGDRLRLPRGVQLDLGATAKAMAADQAAGRVAEELGCGVLVSLGGDIATAGPAPEEGWQITVQDVPADHAQQITLTAGAAIATSSTVRRTWTRGGRTVHHLVDPDTGRPARSAWRSVSVVAPTCLEANAASTAALVKGTAAAWWLSSRGLPARLIGHGGSIVTLNDWPIEEAA